VTTNQQIAKEHQGLQDDEGITYIQTLQLGRFNNLEYVSIKNLIKIESK